MYFRWLRVFFAYETARLVSLFLITGERDNMKKWKWVWVVTIILVLAVTSTACSNANEASKQKGKIATLPSLLKDFTII